MTKYLIPLLVIIYSMNAMAYSCPEAAMAEPVYAAGIEHLRAVQGSYSLGTCLIEIRVCDQGTATKDSNLFAEIFVHDKYNREQYAPLYHQDIQKRKSKTQIESYSNSLFYVFKDRIEDDLNGKQERITVDIFRDKKTGLLKKLDLGIYGTKRRVQRFPFVYTSQWSSCSGELTRY